MGNKLFTKDFTLVIIGQIISLFGNTILRFALPLYLLRETDSVALFGLVSALSFIPMIIMSLIGGVVADRKNKRNIMVILDFLTAITVLVYVLFYKNISFVPFLIFILMILYGIQGTYQPAVQASIPLLLNRDKIMQGNSIINLVNSLANLIGPAIGGILFGIYGIMPILIVSIICFVFSAIIEIFIKIPFDKSKSCDSIFSIIKDDMILSINFILKEKSILGKAILIISAFNLFLTSMLIVGMPSIIIKTLNLSDELYGIAQGVLAMGSIMGGIITGILSKKLNIKNLHYLLIACTFSIIPMVLVLLYTRAPLFTYVVISAMGFFIMIFATMFSIQMMTFIQMQTPPEIVGKVISCLLGVSLCAMPIGQALYGALFQNWLSSPENVLIGAIICSLIISIFSKYTFRQLN